MQERQKDPVKIKPKRLDVLVSDIPNKEQCKTLYDLEKMKDDEFALRMEALALLERILEPRDPELLEQLLYMGGMCADSRDYDKSIDLLLYASKLRQNNDIGFPAAI